MDMHRNHLAEADRHVAEGERIAGFNCGTARIGAG
jgi:hypothetical protein